MAVPPTGATIWGILRESLVRWNDHNAPRFGASIAFYTLLSLAPLVAICTAIVSAAFGSKVAQSEIMAIVHLWVGDEAAKTISELIDGTQHPSGIWSGALTLLVFFLGASSVFSELRSALNQMWDAPETGTGFLTGLIRQKAFAFGMTLAAGMVLLATTALSVILAVFEHRFGAWLPVSPVLLETVNVAASVCILSALLALIFRLVPDIRLPWKPLFLGAAITTVLFTVGRTLLDVYFGKTVIGSVYGAAGSLVVLIVWVYYSAQIFLLGAEITKVYADQRYSKESLDRRLPGRPLMLKSVQMPERPAR
jgi:membrane protein